MLRFFPVFRSSILQLALSPDSRGCVLFSLSKWSPVDGKSLTPLTSQDVLTCEYLTDLHNINMQAMKWILEHCEEIVEDNRHIYWKFKEIPWPKIL
jgi:hypothetical protein